MAIENNMKYKNIREEELKNKVGADRFKQFDTTEILGNINFTMFPNVWKNALDDYWDSRGSQQKNITKKPD